MPRRDARSTLADVASQFARLRTTRTDGALATAFVVAGLTQVVMWPIARGGLGEIYILGSTLPLAWRRTYPIEAALVSSTFWLIPLDGFPVLGFVVVILQFYALGSWGAPRSAVVLTSLYAVTTAVIGTLLGPEPPVAAIGGVLAVVAPVLAGQVVRRLRHQNQALADLTRTLQDERHKAEEAAVGAERGRIAQELHDVVGHEMTLIAIQAEAAATALRVSPERAAEPVEAIRRTAHRTLREIRAVLEVLAPRDDGGAVSDGLAELSRRARTAGIENSLEVTGTPWPEHAPATLAVNRIVRECLTNAGRHAPGVPVALSVDWREREVLVHATNATDVRGTPVAGRGLTGMRHRAELLGGTFDADCRDGRFDVRVLLPAAAKEVR
jgi:signal transduction histidine kinase